MGDTTIFPALIQNAALLLAMAFIYDLLTSRHRVGPWPLLVQIAVGFALGGLGIIIMLSPWRYVPGIVFDTRSVLLGISGLFFGVVPTVVAMTMTAAFRLSQGGAAAWVGVAVILTTGTIGIAWGHHRRRALADLSWRELYLFGLLIHLDMLALMLILPWPTAMQVLAHITLPVLLIYPLATTLLGMLMVNRLRRENFDTHLQINEERLRLALMAANQGLYDLNVQTGEGKVSAEYATMLGYDPAEFHETNARWLDRLHPDDREPIAAIYRDYIAGKIPQYRVEFRQRTKTNDWKWILSLGKVVEYNAAGLPLRMVGTHTDITERKRAEETLRKSKQQYDQLAANIPLGVYLLRTTPMGGFAFEYVSPRMGALLGVSPENIVLNPQVAFQTIHPADLPAFTRLNQERIEARQPFEWEGRAVVNGATKWLRIQSQPELQESGDILWHGIVEDITERTQADEAQQQLQKQLTQAQKMESIGTLAGGIAHDFNNILAAILGFTDLAKYKLPEGSDLRHDLDNVLQAGLRAKELVKQILAFSRQAEQERQPLEVYLVLKEALKLLRASIPTTIAFQLAIDEKSGAVLADPTQIHQMIMNLCTNAYHAMRTNDSGVLGVALRPVEICEAEANGLLRPGKYLELAVSDTGCGMTPAIMERIFDPYFTTKPQGEGTGLGLAMVHGIVTQYGGEIRAESTLGHGTTFRVYLPQAAREAPGVERIIAQQLPGGNERVLVVDDEPTVLAMHASMLERLGYQVTALPSSQEALAEFASRPQEFDLLLTDMAMPGIPGDILAHKIRQLRPDIPILMCTGFNEKLTPERAKAVGIGKIIMKPLLFRELATSIREFIDS